VVSLTSRPALPFGKMPPLPDVSEAGDPQSQSRRGVEENVPAWNRNPVVNP